jgi:hypothetical protein
VEYWLYSAELLIMWLMLHVTLRLYDKTLLTLTQHGENYTVKSFVVCIVDQIIRRVPCSLAGIVSRLRVGPLGFGCRHRL